eukprot:scaffold52904_cov21-Tisochrysis_lutea.AAC.1
MCFASINSSGVVCIGILWPLVRAKRGYKGYKGVGLQPETLADRLLVKHGPWPVPQLDILGEKRRHSALNPPVASLNKRHEHIHVLVQPFIEVCQEALIWRCCAWPGGCFAIPSWQEKLQELHLHWILWSILKNVLVRSAVWKLGRLASQVATSCVAEVTRDSAEGIVAGLRSLFPFVGAMPHVLMQPMHEAQIQWGRAQIRPASILLNTRSRGWCSRTVFKAACLSIKSVKKVQQWKFA